MKQLRMRSCRRVNLTSHYNQDTQQCVRALQRQMPTRHCLNPQRSSRYCSAAVQLACVGSKLVFFVSGISLLRELMMFVGLQIALNCVPCACNLSAAAVPLPNLPWTIPEGLELLDANVPCLAHECAAIHCTLKPCPSSKSTVHILIFATFLRYCSFWSAFLATDLRSDQ
jgi:hypothetical protein